MAQEEESAAVTALHPAAGQAPPPDPQCRDTQPVCLRLAVRYAPDMVLLKRPQNILMQDWGGGL